MIYTLEKRKGTYYGSLVTFYELRSYTRRSERGWLLNGETLKEFNTKKEANKYIKDHNINIEG